MEDKFKIVRYDDSQEPRIQQLIASCVQQINARDNTLHRK
jgi:hypothetical protein